MDKLNEYIQGEQIPPISKIMHGSKIIQVKKKCLSTGHKECNQGDINNLKITTIKENKKTTKNIFGCLMLEFSISNWEKLKTIINEDDLYNKDDLGFEENPHITLLFGFKPEFKDVDKLKEITSKIKTPIKVKIINISVFETSKFDVLKFDVESDELKDINKQLLNLPHEELHKNYHPHMTIAYLKLGTGKKYNKIKIKEPFPILESSGFLFSTVDDEKFKWD